MRSAGGKAQRARGVRQQWRAPRRCRAPRPAPRRRCRRPAAASIARAAAVGGQVGDRRRSASSFGRSILRDEQFAMPAEHRHRDRASPGRAGGEQRQAVESRTAAPTSRSPCRARRRSPTRRPVKLPGPTPTRMLRRDMAVEHLGDHRHQPFGMAAADLLVALGDDRRRRGVEQRGGAGRGRRVERQDHRRSPMAVDVMRHRRRPRGKRKAAEAVLDRFDGLDFGDIMLDQAFDPALQRHRRRRAAGAGALHARGRACRPCSRDRRCRRRPAPPPGGRGFRSIP